MSDHDGGEDIDITEGEPLGDVSRPDDESETDDTTVFDEPSAKAKVKTAASAVGLLLLVSGFWYLYYSIMGPTMTVASIMGVVVGAAMLPLIAVILPIDAGGYADILDTFGASSAGAWGLYLNSRERQEFVPVDREGGVAYTSDGDLEFDVTESTEYQVAKRPFYFLYYIGEHAAETYRDGVSGDDVDTESIADGGAHVFDRFTMDGQLRLATQKKTDRDIHLIDRKGLLSRFQDAGGGSITLEAKQKILKEEGGGANFQPGKMELIAMAMGAATGLIANLIV